MSDEARKDPAYQAASAHAKELHEEIEKWEQMDSRNIPSEAKLKEETLRSLRHALASVDESFARGGEPQADPVSEQMLLGTKDIKDERGCRRLIRELWANIKALHGPDADGRQVRRVLNRSLSLGDKCHSLKTIQNCLINLRRENLIP